MSSSQPEVSKPAAREYQPPQPQPPSVSKTTTNTTTTMKPPSAVPAFGTLPPDIVHTPTPFILSVPGPDVAELPRLASKAQFGVPSWYNTQADVAAGNLGVSRDWLANATQTWVRDFDWRTHERRQNSVPNYRLQVTAPSDGEVYDLHFAALFSQRRDAVPVILMHGWPGAWTEFLGVLDLLVHKYTPDTLPYHVVVPSIPDYGLSSRPGELEKEIDMDNAAEALNQLMVDLGFGKKGYIAQGGDVGYFLARTMAWNHAECKAWHANMFFMSQEEIEVTKNIPITPEEQAQVAQAMAWASTGSAYASEHGTRPSTLALVLMTNPVAMLAWMGEKFVEWSDNRDPSYSLPLDTILAHVAFYWYTKSYGRSMWAYRFLTSVIGRPLPVAPLSQDKPFGYSWFPVEIASLPEAWAQALFPNLVFHRRHEKGGHFAALQEPVGFMEDMEDFVAAVKEKGTFS